MTLAGIESPYLGVLLDAGFELVFPGRPFQLNEDELLGALPGICAVIAGSMPNTHINRHSDNPLPKCCR